MLVCNVTRLHPLNRMGREGETLPGPYETTTMTATGTAKKQ